MEMDGRPLKMIPMTYTPRKNSKNCDFFRFYFFLFLYGELCIFFFFFFFFCSKTLIFFFVDRTSVLNDEDGIFLTTVQVSGL